MSKAAIIILVIAFVLVLIESVIDLPTEPEDLD